MVAKAKVRLEGEDATAVAFKSALGNAQKTANKMSGAFKAAFAGISVASVLSVAKASIALGDELSNAAKNAGITGSAMSELAYVAKQSDVELTALSKSIKTMKVALSEAASGSKEPLANLKAIGLTIEDLRGLKADEQFELIGDAIQRMGDETDRTRARVAFFGKAGDDLGRVFENGAAGVRKLREEAIATGAALSDDTIKKLADADDAVKALQSSWEGFAASMTAKVAPALKTAMDFWAGAPRSIAQQIADLEDQIANTNGTRGASAESYRKMYRERLAQLRKLAAEESAREMGVVGSTQDDPAPPPGFTNQAALDAEARAQREREELIADTDARIIEEHYKAAEDLFITQLEYENELSEVQIENAKKLDDWRAEQAASLSENAQLFKDAFLNAWDDMVNTGKFKWDELLKYMLAEFSRRGIEQLFDSMFSNKSGSGGGGGGWLNTGLQALAAMFGGSRDSGGRGEPGRVYDIGTGAQPERFIPDSAGTFIPRGGRGNSAPNVNINYNMDNRGATQEFAKLLPGILKRHGEQITANLVQGIRNGRIPV